MFGIRSNKEMHESCLKPIMIIEWCRCFDWSDMNDLWFKFKRTNRTIVKDFIQHQDHAHQSYTQLLEFVLVNVTRLSTSVWSRLKGGAKEVAKGNQSDKEVTRCTNFQPWLIVPRINAFAQQSLFHQYSRGRVTLITLKPDHYLLEQFMIMQPILLETPWFIHDSSQIWQGADLKL